MITNVNDLFLNLKEILSNPGPYEQANTSDLWNTPHISKQMLKYHLDLDVEAASRTREFINTSVDWFINKFDLTSESRVLDLGCGPGLYTHEFAKTGADVTGIDLSENSIRYAGEKAHKDNHSIKYINANYIDYDFEGQFDLITLVYFDFCALNPEQRAVLLKKISKALNAGGSFVLDILTPAHFASIEESLDCSKNENGGFWSPNNYISFEQIFKYDDEQLILEKSTVIEADAELTICNYLKCFQLQEFKDLLKANGLTANELFSDISGTSFKEDSTGLTIVAGKKS